jgi:nitroreductase
MIERIGGWIIAEIELSGNVVLQNSLLQDWGGLFRNAPSLIVISTGSDSRTESIDAAAAAENILIAAESMSLASCWIGTVPCSPPVCT